MGTKMLNNKELFVVALLSAISFIFIYGVQVLNPLYTDWLLSDGGDLSQHYLGWKAYRVSQWHFPVGMVDTLAYPNLTSIIFTDSIPVFAVFFKMFESLLPVNFQYFGLWGILCFVLQGVFTAKIVRSYTDNNIAVVTCSILMLFTPVMIFRMFAHTALAGQWLILLGLSVLLGNIRYRKNDKIYILVAFMGILSSSVHMYFVLMNGIILVGICVIDFFDSKSVKRSVLCMIDYLISVFLVTFLLGGFSSGMDARNGGLGVFSFNLNGLLNSQGWSCVFDSLPLYGDGQYEGFAYLGAGGLFLFIVAILLLIKNVDSLKRTVLKHYKLITVLFLISLVALIISVSPVITFNSKIIVDLTSKFPPVLIDIWSVFRASGRVVWIAVYVIEFISIIVVCKKIRNEILLNVVIILSLVFQIYDLHHIIEGKHNLFGTQTIYSSELRNEGFYDVLAKNDQLKHIVFVEPAIFMDHKKLYAITDWALNNGKTINDFYFARPMPTIEKAKKKSLEELAEQNIYVFTKNTRIFCLQYDLNYYCIDDIIFGYSKPINGFEKMKGKDFSSQELIYSNNLYLIAGRDTENGRLLYPNGISFGPYWQIPKGKYICTILGSKLPERLSVMIYSDKGKRHHSFTIL